MLKVRRPYYMNLLEPIREARKKKERAKKIKSAKQFAAAATIGSAAGAIAGLLLAPKSGKETRQVISKNVKSASENVRNSAANVKEKAVEVQKNIKTALEKTDKLIKDLKQKKAKKEVGTEEQKTDEE